MLQNFKHLSPRARLMVGGAFLILLVLGAAALALVQ